MTKASVIRRTVAVVAVAAIVAACGGGATPSPKKYTFADMHVGFIQTGSESGWRSANTASFKDEAAAKKIDLHFYDAQNKVENQITAFKNFNNDSSINVIILAALDVTGYDDVLKEAKQKGKVVVLEDRRINADSSLYATYIGSDFVEEGHKVATLMCEALKNAKTRHIAEITGAVGASAGIDRAKGFREKLACADGTAMDIPDGLSQTGNWGVPESKAVMEAFLKKTKDIQGVFGHNDEEAIGAIQAIKEAGLVPGKDIMVIGVDATANGFNAMISGDLYADVECNPLLGPQVYDAALKALNGETLPKWVPSQETQFSITQGVDQLKEILKNRKY